MFHKKTLSATIAVALSFGVSAAQAAYFDMYIDKKGIPGSTIADMSPYKVATSLKYAYEQFGDATGAGKLLFPFRVRYTLSKSIPNDIDLYVTFTLGNGATWQKPLSSMSLDIQDKTGKSLFGSGTVPEWSIVNKGSTSDSTVSFLINTSKKVIGPDQILDFTFLVDNAEEALRTPGGQITLTATVIKAQTAKDFVTGDPADQTMPLTLATSGEGTAVTFKQKDAGAAAYISVVSDGKTFEGSGKENDTQVAYGVVGLSDDPTFLDKDTTCVVSGPYLPTTPTTACGAPKPWTSKGKMSAGQILIEDGNFSASGKASDNNVYINTATKTFADEFTNATTAKWVLDKTDFDNILALGLNSPKLMLTVTGDTEIVENRQTQPKGTLVIEFNSGNTVTRSTFLRHLKKNGTVCTLYNIPPSDALDIINIRITNDSPSVDGFVKGKLRDMDNKVIFTGKTLIEQGGLKPHQTVRLQMEDLKADGSEWKGRAVLVLESNIPHPLMQVYGLLRAREATGFPETPLMNMSTGATGNSCD